MRRRHVTTARRRPFFQRYFSYPVEGHDRQKLPLLHVRLIGQGTLRSVALVDSGATVTFVPPELAEALGLDVVDRDVPAEGAGGGFLNNICKFSLEIIKGAAVVHSLRGQAHVPQEEGRIPFIVLGRDHLFADFDITFRERQQRVSFKPSR